MSRREITGDDRTVILAIANEILMAMRKIGQGCKPEHLAHAAIGAASGIVKDCSKPGREVANLRLAVMNIEQEIKDLERASAQHNGT